jgi:hypothetical protein
MGIKDVITDRIRKLRGGMAMEQQVAKTWLELAIAVGGDALDVELRERVLALRQRLDDAGGKADARLAQDLLQNQLELCQAVKDLALRGRMLGEGTRTIKRSATSLEMRVAQLQDEIGRVRNLIDQECRRRGIRAPTMGDDSNLVEELYRVFENISRRNSQRMQTAAADPILKEVLALIDSQDAHAIDRFPRYLREPAKRLMALVTERNRYRKLLENQGLLPPQ